MKKLKRVIQADGKGCTIACLSMITGMKYFEMRQCLYDNARRIIYANNLVASVDGTVGLFHHELKEALKTLFNIDSQWIQFTSIAALKKHCILFLGDLGHTGQHVVVFDAKARKILQPARGWTTNHKIHTKNTCGKFVHKNNVCNCLEIQ